MDIKAHHYAPKLSAYVHLCMLIAALPWTVWQAEQLHVCTYADELDVGAPPSSLLSFNPGKSHW